MKYPFETQAERTVELRHGNLLTSGSHLLACAPPSCIEHQRVIPRSQIGKSGEVFVDYRSCQIDDAEVLKRPTSGVQSFHNRLDLFSVISRGIHNAQR